MFTRWMVFHVASGQSFFSGAACLVVAVLLSGVKKGQLNRTIRNILLPLACLLVFVSATPLPTWSYFLLVSTTLLWSATLAWGHRIRSQLSLGLRLATVSLWLAAMLVEIPYHLMPKVPRLGQPTLGIIGDSVTAGTGDIKVQTWPGIVEHRNGVAIHDHSQAGAGVASAMRQAEAVTSDERLLLIEIGGNDILGGTSPVEFEAGLEKLLVAVRRPGRVIIMMELPLPPTFNAYGRIQRGLARRYGALLVPKRVLLGILQQPEGTSDSIHLTEIGHKFMAKVIWSIVGDAFDTTTGASINRTHRESGH